MRKPLLLMFVGKAGTGKTTLARNIVGKTNIAYFDYDTLVQPFLTSIERRYGLGSDSRLEFYREWRDSSYATIMDVVVENLKLGNDVMMSAPCSAELADSSFPGRLRERVGIPFWMRVFQMAPPSSLHKQRVQERNSKRDIDVIEGKEIFSDVFKPVPCAWKEDIIILDSGDLSKNSEIVLKVLETLRRSGYGIGDDEV